MVPIPSCLHSTFKYLSNEYSHAQIRVQTKKLWPRQVGEKKTGCCQESMSRPGEYVSTGKYVAIGSMSRQAVSCDRCRDKQYVATDVATSKLCRDKKA